MNTNYDESSRFLGMLAEVAVKTLNAEQHNQSELKAHKKANKHVLNVDQMRKLSDKVLVESFSELSCDEIRRIFQYKCVLMPQKCGLVCESFAVEERARTLMRDHLLDHIRNVELDFTAETVSARNKRLNDGNRLWRNCHSKSNAKSVSQTNKIVKNTSITEISDENSCKIQCNHDLSSDCLSSDDIKCENNEKNMRDIGKGCEDHCYTSLEGPKVKSTPVEKSDDNLLCSKKKCLNVTKVISTPAFPFIYEPVLPNISQVIEIGPTLGNQLSKINADSSQTVSHNVVDELNTNALQLKRLALQYINDIRVKTRGQTDKSSFRCKICIDKTFTSPTTLIYHYRSHAGVKPFECSLCKSTFTRQHSLNYHMLIHLNKSRFVCEECGRNFRHPSHFKEHMRRHTGETPYECNDCFIKFKTRNTYKRHLQTKHSKMLTSKGIFDLPDNDLHIRKPCPPRRKYGLGFLHQNIEAVARYERAQQEVNQTIKSKCHVIEAIDSNHILINNFNSSKNNFEKLLQAVAIAEDNNRSIIT
ncbi:unnamed protein product [Medioppia subpectinata]|uniref:C2H2-type domain-containing protein n=1 Tax=Medioppia subpectinata TaxID=1979941 RepID=A0A7R9KHQ1_9ACAR|nr:unnamed protein product [Medioppia subpectinata]CAG2102753.1 unnamed protein product [Medioppia subpectinata]